MKRRACSLLISFALAGPACAEAPSVDEWTDSMMARLPFQNGVVTKEGYARLTAAYVREKRQFFDVVFARLIGKAKEKGLSDRAAALARVHDTRVKDLVVTADLAARSVFVALDPDHDGVIRFAEARALLLKLANASDLNDNGVLDDGEQSLAEWCLSTGRPVPSKKDRRAIDDQFRQIDSSDW